MHISTLLGVKIGQSLTLYRQTEPQGICTLAECNASRQQDSIQARCKNVLCEWLMFCCYGKALPWDWQLHDPCNFLSAEFDLITFMVHLPKGCINLCKGKCIRIMVLGEGLWLCTLFETYTGFSKLQLSFICNDQKACNSLTVIVCIVPGLYAQMWIALHFQVAWEHVGT